MSPLLLSRRSVLMATGALLGVPSLARSQSRMDTVRILCGFAPGGPADAICRKLAERWTARTGRPAIVENRSGAAGRLAIAELTRAPADGNTLLLTPASTLTLYPFVFRRLDYDPFQDLSPVHTVAATCFALAAGPGLPSTVGSVRELRDWAGTQRASVHCGNSGSGGMQHMLATLLAREARLDLSHVPFRGGAASIQAVAAGEVPLAITTEFAARALHEAGKMRVLATTGTRRMAFPAVPTFEEQGLPALSQREWFGIFTVARTPNAVIEQAASLIGSVLGDPDVKEAWERQGLLLDAMPPQQLQAAIRREYDFWGPVIRQSGFTPEA